MIPTLESPAASYLGHFLGESMLGPSWLRLAAVCALCFGAESGKPPLPDHGATMRSPAARIAFASHRDGNWEIYVMDADGGHQTRLTKLPSQDRFPLWSPDRSKIAFGLQSPALDWELWVMNADGTNQRRLFAGIVAKGAREWSPDGTRIAFAARVDGDVEIFSARVDGSGVDRLTRSPGEDADPSWSPDGRQIAFTSTRAGNDDIYVMRADGSGVRRITNDPAVDRSPTWSPNGSTIAFMSARDGGRDIYLVRPDGGRVERLTVGGESTNDMPRWSPDGSRLAIQVAHGKNYDVEVVTLADRKRVRLAATPAYDGQYSWSPDGGQLAFVSDCEKFNGVYVANADGSNTRRLTGSDSLNPAWWR